MSRPVAPCGVHSFLFGIFRLELNKNNRPLRNICRSGHTFFGAAHYLPRMANGFGRVNQALRADRGFRSAAGLCISFALLGAWTAWALAAKVTRYEVSDSARLEIKGSAYPIQANAAGRLVASGLVLGKEVTAGEILLELDSDEERLNLEEQKAHLASLQPQIAALRAQMSSEGEGRSDDRQVLGFRRRRHALNIRKRKRKHKSPTRGRSGGAAACGRHSIRCRCSTGSGGRAEQARSSGEFAGGDLAPGAGDAGA